MGAGTTPSVLRDDAPFVLCEDARAGGVARLFSGLRETIVAHALVDVAPALSGVRAGLARGCFAAGWLSYEAGRAFETRFSTRPSRHGAHPTPLVWFGLFERVDVLDAGAVSAILPDCDGAWISPPRPRMSRAQYDDAFARAKDYITAGDIYQINMSYRSDLTLLGDPRAAYARLRSAGGGGWSALVHTGADWLLSTSPELFFRLSPDGAIEAKPMKGTAKRSVDPVQDRLQAQHLKTDAKELAENVMIVDLLRNDISRLAKRGSVHVPDLFTVETYPTLHTLTSTVRAQIKDEYDVADVLRALFPCGSITGAPKIRAMEIIDELEADARGPYTGSIGWIAPDGSAEFNVAIRTVSIAGGQAEVGVGSAIVFDSTANGEWEECQTKSAFLTANAPSFGLIETMRFEPALGIARLDLHMARLRRSAACFSYPFEEGAIREALQSALADAAGVCVVRLTLDAGGTARVELKPLPSSPADGLRVRLAPLPVDRSDFRLRHKTTLRAFYDDARRACGADEVVFVDPDGFVTEGSISNVFVPRGGKVVTPPETRGLLPGVLRAALLASGEALEGDLRVSDLEPGFFLGNSVRGLVAAQLESESAQTGQAPRLANSSMATIK